MGFTQSAGRGSGRGGNNKGRVTTRRCYGVKSPGTLWNRLIMDLNRLLTPSGGASPGYARLPAA